MLCYSNPFTEHTRHWPEECPPMYVQLRNEHRLIFHEWCRNPTTEYCTRKGEQLSLLKYFKSRATH
jgi:hypothetical protein